MFCHRQDSAFCAFYYNVKLWHQKLRFALALLYSWMVGVPLDLFTAYFRWLIVITNVLRIIWNNAPLNHFKVLLQRKWKKSLETTLLMGPVKGQEQEGKEKETQVVAGDVTYRSLYDRLSKPLSTQSKKWPTSKAHEWGRRTILWHHNVCDVTIQLCQ